MNKSIFPCNFDTYIKLAIWKMEFANWIEYMNHVGFLIYESFTVTIIVNRNVHNVLKSRIKSWIKLN